MLQRAKARSKVLKETLGKPDVTLSVETRESSPEPADENVAISDQIIEEDEEQQYGHVIKDSPSKAIGNAAAIAAMDSNLSDSPLRRTRLRALAQTINNWEDDYSHHYTPQSSRFNLSSKPKSPLRKLPSSPITLPDTSDNNRVRLAPKSLLLESSVDTVDCRPLTIAQHIEKLCSSELVVASGEKSFDECDASYNSSLGDEALLACCSDDGETSKNSELSDSFTFFAPKPSGNNNSSEGIKADGSSNGESTSEKCVLDDSVIHALVRIPSRRFRGFSRGHRCG